MSKDEFEAAFRAQLGGTGIGIKRYHNEPLTFVEALCAMGFLEVLHSLSSRDVTWQDVLIERLKSGRGSATKGQQRGRFLEDFTEETVREVFGSGGYDTRCRFSGARGTSTEKADFAIPSRSDPGILIEVKAYGATGSKQTDILGDVNRIVAEKRRDTQFLLVTDGTTWRQRSSDLEKLVKLQNSGDIGRIYTMQMRDDLRSDLASLKRFYNL